MQGYDNNRDNHGHSGYYWIETDKVYKVYCDMELSYDGIKRRIVKLDTSQEDDCSAGWKKVKRPQPLCRGSGDAGGCYSAYFSNNKEDYTSICGKVHVGGYHQGFLSAFAKDIPLIIVNCTSVVIKVNSVT